SEVVSRFLLLDYSRAAADRGLTPKEFLARVNPMTGGGKDALAPYTTEVGQPPPGHYRVLVVNNSSCPLEQSGRGMLGLLHQAVIPSALPGRPRVVNSLMLSPGQEGLPPEALRAFIAGGTAASVWPPTHDSSRPPTRRSGRRRASCGCRLRRRQTVAGS